MLVHKDYQDSSSLQAIYRLSITRSKLFLSIFERSSRGKWTWILRCILAGDIKREEKTISRRTDDLVKLGLLEKKRHSVQVAHECAYRITERGYEVVDIIRKLHDYANFIVFTTCLLVTPAEKVVPRVSLNVIYNSRLSRISYSKLQTAPARDPQITQISQTTARKEADVGRMEHKRMEIPEHVLQLTNLLQLTNHGQLKLAVFDKETLDHGMSMVKQSNGCKDIFSELVNVCKQYANDNGIYVPWPSYFRDLEAGVADKKEFGTKKRITSAMIKPKPVRDTSISNNNQAILVQAHRELKKAENQAWQDGRTPQELALFKANRNDFLSIIENMRGESAPDDVKSFLKVKVVEVVETKPLEWSQTDKQLVDWVLNYIEKMSMGKQFYTHYVDEIMLGPDSPRARTGELQAGLRLMQRLAFRELAKELEEPPIKKVVTQLKDQIVCAQIENDDRVWENMKYSPINNDGELEEVFD